MPMPDSAATIAKLRHVAGSERVPAAELAALASEVFQVCGVPRADADSAPEVAGRAQ